MFGCVRLTLARARSFMIIVGGRGRGVVNRPAVAAVASLDAETEGKPLSGAALPAWHRAAPASRHVNGISVATAIDVAPAKHRTAVSCAGRQGMMLAQPATSAPVHTHLVRQ